MLPILGQFDEVTKKALTLAQLFFYELKSFIVIA